MTGHFDYNLQYETMILMIRVESGILFASCIALYENKL